MPKANLSIRRLEECARELPGDYNVNLEDLLDTSYKIFNVICVQGKRHYGRQGMIIADKSLFRNIVLSSSNVVRDIGGIGDVIDEIQTDIVEELFRFRVGRFPKRVPSVEEFTTTKNKSQWSSLKMESVRIVAEIAHKYIALHRLSEWTPVSP